MKRVVAAASVVALMIPHMVAGQGKPLTLLGYHTTVPAGWTTRAPASAMRLAEYVVPGHGSQPGAEVIVYFFGKGMGGNVASNLARWKGQFSSPDGKPVYEKVTRAPGGVFPVTFAEYRGTYARAIGMGSAPEQARPGQTLIAAVAETPNGTLFIQLFGPSARVAAEREAFVKFVSQLARAPHTVNPTT
jgi:hypothetical protein